MNADKIEKLKRLLGGYCLAQGGGSGGYELEDILEFIEEEKQESYSEGAESIIQGM